MPTMSKALADNVLINVPVSLEQQLSSALRTPTSAKMTLFLLNIQSTGGPEHVCRKRHPPLSSFSSLCLFPTYFCPPTVWDCPPTHPRFETLILLSLNYIRTEKDLLIATSFLGGSWRKNGGGQGIPNSIHRAENCAQIKSLHYSHNYFHLDATDSKATHITRFIKR